MPTIGHHFYASRFCLACSQREPRGQLRFFTFLFTLYILILKVCRPTRPSSVVQRAILRPLHSLHLRDSIYVTPSACRVVVRGPVLEARRACLLQHLLQSPPLLAFVQPHLRPSDRERASSPLRATSHQSCSRDTRAHQTFRPRRLKAALSVAGRVWSRTSVAPVAGWGSRGCVRRRL